MKPLTLAIILSYLSFVSCTDGPTTEIRDDFKKYYEQYDVEGTFALYDQNANKYILYNPAEFRRQFIPASTFKICNSLIALETGVIADEHYKMSWDSVVRRVPSWNRDHTLTTAFQNSVVWYYQEIARRVGEDAMKDWLTKIDYGNADTSGGVDQFWLSGGLRISAEEQIDFLKRLRNEELPFSRPSMDIVKKIMITKDTTGYVLRAKTGWSSQDNKDVGWYVGYIETGDNVYYFANCLRTDDPEHLGFGRARLEIVFAILKDLNVTGP